MLGINIHWLNKWCCRFMDRYFYLPLHEWVLRNWESQSGTLGLGIHWVLNPDT